MERRVLLVALKREVRKRAPPDWLDRLASIPGVEVLGERSGRARVSADADGEERVRAELGALCHIEPEIKHRLV